MVARALASAAFAAALSACAPLAVDEPRAAQASLTCMHAALAEHDLKARPDTEAHCIAAGLIARRCSVAEAHLASYGKELRDLFGHGDAEWRDLQSDWRGIACARSASDAAGLIACCTN